MCIHKYRGQLCVYILQWSEYLPAELSVGCPAPCDGTAPSSPPAASELQSPSASAPPPTSGPQPEQTVNVSHQLFSNINKLWVKLQQILKNRNPRTVHENSSSRSSLTIFQFDRGWESLPLGEWGAAWPVHRPVVSGGSGAASEPQPAPLGTWKPPENAAHPGPCSVQHIHW